MTFAANHMLLSLLLCRTQPVILDSLTAEVGRKTSMTLVSNSLKMGFGVAFLQSSLFVDEQLSAIYHKTFVFPLNVPPCYTKGDNCESSCKTTALSAPLPVDICLPKSQQIACTRTSCLRVVFACFL
jgi:hypothetical protein